MAFERHKNRTEKIKNFIANNKVFATIATVSIIFLCCNYILSKKESTITENSSQVSSEAVEVETTDGDIEEEDSKWRFYWIDLWIFLGAGSFCTVKILQEKKKAREKLK